LNTPDEGNIPRPVKCRQLSGAPIDAAATKRLLQILHTTEPAPARATRVAAELRGANTFEALEAHACRMVDSVWNESTTYTAFVDTLIPLLINNTAMHLPSGATPQLIGPSIEQRYDFYPRKVTATWHAVPKAAHYLVEVREYMGITPLDRRGPMAWVPHNDGLHSAQTTDTTATFYFIGEGRGEWRVRTIGRRGESSDPSEWRTFIFPR
ncbi:MAG: hypothetical protein ABI852_11230, partial [Gemmatimonadaceae bacterium]